MKLSDFLKLLRGRSHAKQIIARQVAMNGQGFSCRSDELPTAPLGWFWKRDLAGKRKWRLRRAPSKQMVGVNQSVTTRLDGVEVRRSAWGYLKPTYHNPDEIRRKAL